MLEYLCNAGHSFISPVTSGLHPPQMCCLDLTTHGTGKDVGRMSFSANTNLPHLGLSTFFFFLSLVHYSCVLNLHYLHYLFKQESCVSNVVPLPEFCASLYFQLWPWKSKGSRSLVSSMFWDTSRSLFHLWPHTDSGVDQVLLQEKTEGNNSH